MSMRPAAFYKAPSRLAVSFAAGGLLGALVVAWIATAYDDVTLRDTSGASVASASGPMGGPREAMGGDPRITWVGLSSSAVSPLYADGDSIVFVGAEGDRPTATVYRYWPATGHMEALADFTPDGQLAGVVRMGDSLVVAHGEFVTLVEADGTLSHVGLPKRNNARSASDSELRQEVRSIAVIGGTIYATRFNVQGLEAISFDGNRGEPVLLSLPGDLAPPVTLAALPNGDLVVGSPFDFHDLHGGTVVFRPGLGVVQRFDQVKVYSAGVLDGRLVATQTSDGELAAFEDNGQLASVSRPIPLTGKEDRLAAHGDVLVVAPEGTGVLFVSIRQGSAESIALPVYEGEPSQPWSPNQAPGQRPDPVSFTSAISSLAITEDGHIVFVAEGIGVSLGVLSIAAID